MSRALPYNVVRSVEKPDAWLVMHHDFVTETNVCVAVFTGEFLAGNGEAMANEYASWKNNQPFERESDA